MAAFYNVDLKEKIQDEALVLDTNLLSSLFLDRKCLEDFMTIFPKNPLLLDPIVKLEFLRGAFRADTYKEQNDFLEYVRLGNMADNQDIQIKIYDYTFNIARICSHRENPNMPLADILIIGRLAVYEQTVFFITRDYDDFNTILFDRLGIVSLERKLKSKLGPREIVENFQILKFNHNKYKKCLETLPQ